MSLKRPIIAIIAFAVLLAVYTWDVDNVERDILRELQSNQVLFHEPAKAVELTFETEGEMLKLERDGTPDSLWRITVPSELPANQSVINAFLENLRGARRHGEFVSDDLHTHGLDVPRRRVILGVRNDSGDIDRYTLAFGNQPVSFGNVYARIEGDRRIFTVSEWLFRQSGKNLASVRDKSLSIMEIARGLKLTIEGPRGNFSVERESMTATDWLVHTDSKIPLPADRVLVDRVLGNIAHAEFVQIFDNPTSTPLQLGFEPARLKFSVDGNTTFEVGNIVDGREQFYLRTGSGIIGTVPRSQLGDFFRPPVEWGSKRFIWFKREEIQQVQSKSGNATLNLLSDRKAGWIFADSPGIVVRPDYLENFLTALLSIAANQLITPAASDEELLRHGIVDESFTINVTSTDGRTQGLRFGRTDTREGITYVHRLQDNSLWKIDFTQQGRIFLFRRDLEERRVLPGLTAKTARIDVETQDAVIKIERTGAAWQGAFPGNSPAIIPPSLPIGFLEAFEALERASEMMGLGNIAPIATFRFYEATGANSPFASIALISRNKDTRMARFLLDGKFIEVEAEQFDKLDDEMVKLFIALKSEQEKQAEAPAVAPKQSP